MSANYNIVIYEWGTGRKLLELSDYLNMTYSNKVNAPGTMQLQLSGTHHLKDILARNLIFEVHRERPDLGVSNYVEYTGVLRGWERSYQNKKNRLKLFVPELKHMLSWRYILWRANQPALTVFTNQPGDDIMKTLVDWNIGPNARYDYGRLRTGTLTGLTLQGVSSSGNHVNWRCAWDNLLESLQGLVGVAHCDFDLVMTTPAHFEFRTYQGQRGTDKSAQVTFALNYGNMDNPVYTNNMTELKTVAAVLGQGQEDDREAVVTSGANFVGGVDDIELKVDAADVDPGQTNTLIDRGQAALYQNQGELDFTFDVVQTPSAAYGKHYVVGDLVTNIYEEVTLVRKVARAQVTHNPDDGNETIAVEMDHV